MKTRGKFTILVAVVLVAVLLTFLVSFQVRMDETAIVYTFGRATREITEAGFCLKLPYPIQTVTKYSKRTRIFEGKFQEYLTRDQHNLIVEIAAGWSIERPAQFEEKVGSEGSAEEKMAALVGGAANAIVNSHELADFISIGTDHAYANVEAEIHKAVEAEAIEQYGIRVSLLWITRLGLPEDVTKQVVERIKEERGAKAKALRAEGDSKAEGLKAQADTKAKEILTKAEAEARLIRGEADKTASAHYAVFKEDPDLANFLTSIEAIRNLKKRTTYILTPDTPPYHLLSPSLKIPGAESPKAPDPVPPKAREN
ncbi:MAG TPA: protease modulator HflC [Planctomycetota bacterium]|nr:protease modulator HflC [Planctomycetota bacterium]